MSVVYFVRMGNGPVKIGYTSNLKKRMLAISQGLPEPAHLLASIPGGRELELRLHRALHEHRLRLEWFKPDRELLAVATIAKAKGGEAVERWLSAKETSDHSRNVEFVATDSFESDIRALIQIAFKNAVGRYGKSVVAGAVGKSVDAVEGYISGKALPSVVTFLNLEALDPDAVAPFHARCSSDALTAQLAKLAPRSERA